MCAIAMLDKEEKREIGLTTRAKDSIMRETRQKPVNVLCVAERPGRPDIQFLMRGSSYPFIPIATS